MGDRGVSVVMSHISWCAVEDRGVSMVMSHMLGCCGGSRCIYGDVAYAG